MTGLSFVQKLGFLANRLFEQSGLYRLSKFDRLWVSIYFIYKHSVEGGLEGYIKKNPSLFRVTLDVGGGMGYHAKLIALNVEDSRVECFEPERVNASRIRRLLKDDNLSNVNLHDLAVTNKSAKVRLIRNKYNPGDHNIQHDTPNGLEVDGVDLDSFCSRNSIRPTFIKIDVQGHELFVLEGARQLLSETKPALLIEFDPSLGRQQLTAYWDYLVNFKYQAFEITAMGELRPVAVLPDRSRYFDLLFIAL